MHVYAHMQACRKHIHVYVRSKRAVCSYTYIGAYTYAHAHPMIFLFSKSNANLFVWVKCKPVCVDFWYMLFVEYVLEKKKPFGSQHPDQFNFTLKFCGKIQIKRQNSNKIIPKPTSRPIQLEA